MTRPMIRVLLVDDHLVVRRGIRDFLEEAGDITVIAEAETAADALTLARSHRPDVVVLDIKLPDGSGLDVARELRSSLAEAGLLILTAYDDDPYVRAALDVGVNGYVMKSADADVLVDAVRAVREGQRVFTEVLLHRSAPRSEGSMPEPLDPLTPRELDVLRLAAEGLTNKAIGYQLGISDRTVQGHLANIYSKLDVSGRTEMVSRAIALALFRPGDA